MNCKNCEEHIHRGNMGVWLHTAPEGGGVNVCMIPGNTKKPYIVAEPLDDNQLMGYTRKLIIDIDLEAGSEEVLDAVEANFRKTYEDDDGNLINLIYFRGTDRKSYSYRITAGMVVNDGPVEL